MGFKKLLIYVIFICSCSPLPISKTVKRDFTNCYEAGNTGLSSKLNINGYYEIRDPIKNNDASNVNMIFFKDGSYVRNFFPENGMSIEEYLSNVDKDSNFYNWAYWGIYKVKNDTIICQYMSNKSLTAPRIIREIWYKIIDSTTIKLFFNTKLAEKVEVWQQRNFNSYVDRDVIATLTSCNCIPPSNSWIKKQLWTTCAEQSREERKRQISDYLVEGEYFGSDGSKRASLRISDNKAFLKCYDIETKNLLTDTISLSSFHTMNLLGEKLMLLRRANKLYLAKRNFTEEQDGFIIKIKYKTESSY